MKSCLDCDAASQTATVKLHLRMSDWLAQTNILQVVDLLRLISLSLMQLIALVFQFIAA